MAAPTRARPPDHDLLYGRHAVLESLLAGRRHVRQVYVSQHVQHSEGLDQIMAAARRAGCPVGEIPPAALEAVGPVNHQGVLAEAGHYPYVKLDALLALLAGAGRNQALYLVLDHLQDVQNLGTLLRTAEAMAVTGVLLPDRRSAGITPAVVNSSAGAVEHLQVAQVGNLVQALQRLKGAGVWVAGLDAAPAALALDQTDLSGPLAVVVGAESGGLARLTREQCDWLVRIPMYGRVASLNAAVAGSIVLAAARTHVAI